MPKCCAHSSASTRCARFRSTPAAACRSALRRLSVEPITRALRLGSEFRLPEIGRAPRVSGREPCAKDGSKQPSRGPILDFDDDVAHRAARASSARIREGNARGVLDGVPVAIKEEVAVQGLPLRVGTAWIDGKPAPQDSTPVRRLREAGAIVIGTTPMTEYGMSPLGANVHRVMPRNAHHDGRLPGGSSSGSGVAVATGVVPVALGADGGGSIRIPASLNGVFGLKPTFGRVPVVGHGVRGGSSVVHLGPLGASSYDLALFLEAVSGRDEGDPASIGQPRVGLGEFVDAIGRGARGLRIGIIDDEWSAASTDIARAGKEALRGLEKDGAELVSVGLELAKHATAIGYLTIGLEFFTNSIDLRRSHMDQLGLDVQLLLANLETFRADDYLDAQKLRAELRRQVAHLFDRVDVLALPTTATTATRCHVPFRIYRQSDRNSRRNCTDRARRRRTPDRASTDGGRLGRSRRHPSARAFGATGDRSSSSAEMRDRFARAIIGFRFRRPWPSESNS